MGIYLHIVSFSEGRKLVTELLIQSHIFRGPSVVSISFPIKEGGVVDSSNETTEFQEK